MADIKSKAARSYNMSRIRWKDTKPEIRVRKFLHSKGFRFRLHASKLAGKPDIILPKYKTVIFVHGCYWHHHEGCKFATIPSTNTGFWKDKILANRRRDVKNATLLKKDAWKVLTIWECETKSEQELTHLAERIYASV